LAAVLIWIYYSSMIYFFGAEFTQVYAKARGHGVKPSKHAQSLSKCDETETATPSPLPPSEKPERPAVEGSRPAPIRDRQGEDRPSQAVAGDGDASKKWVALVTLVSGAVVGAIGASKIRRLNFPQARDLAAARLNSRLVGMERKMARVDTLQSCLRDRG